MQPTNRNSHNHHHEAPVICRRLMVPCCFDWLVNWFITFRMRHSQGEMYIGHGRLCVCLFVCLSLAAFPHYCTDPDITWGNGRRCRLVVHYWADLQSVHRFCCYDNIAPNTKCLQVLVLALCLIDWLMTNLLCCKSKLQRCELAHHNHFTALFPGPPGWAGARRELTGLYGAMED